MQKKKCSLDDVMITFPCSMDWEFMAGDDRKRLCSGCSKYVYNIADMSSAEALEFLSRNGEACKRLLRRPDGTLVTDECPRFLRPLRNGFERTKRIAIALLSFLLMAPEALAQHEDSTNKQRSARSRKTTPLPQPLPISNTTVISNAANYKAQPMVGGVAGPPAYGNAGDELTNNGNCSSPIMVLRKKQQAPNVTHGKMEMTASHFYNKAETAFQQGNLAVAKLQYQNALSAFDNQTAHGDHKFRKLINDRLDETIIKMKKQH